MRERKPCSKSGSKSQRKLSEIIIEIARIGFTAAFRNQDPAPPALHILVFLAQEAWNREVLNKGPVLGREYRNRFIEDMINRLGLSHSELKQQLISTDLETIIEMMRTYKSSHFADDRREIVSCGSTPQETLRVTWK